MKIHRLKNPIYGLPTFLCVEHDHIKFAEIVARKYPGCDVEQFCEGQGCCFFVVPAHSTSRVYFVWLRDFNLKDPQDFACLAHELYHLVRQQFSYLVVKEEEGTSEAGAYFMGSMMLQAIQMLTGRKK